jgi:hypothetical protein
MKERKISAGTVEFMSEIEGNAMAATFLLS